jgi:hypothetical protein
LEGIPTKELEQLLQQGRAAEVVASQAKKGGKQRRKASKRES